MEETELETHPDRPKATPPSRPSRTGTDRERYKHILESIEDGYYEVDLKGDLVFFNPALQSLLGYKAEELLGMNNRVYMSEGDGQEGLLELQRGLPQRCACQGVRLGAHPP